MKNNVSVRESYVAPKVKVTGMAVHGVLCQSGSTIEDFNPLDDDSKNWQ